MKILIDIDELEKNGVVTSELATVLRGEAIREIGSSTISILLALGAIAIVIGLFYFISTHLLHFTFKTEFGVFIGLALLFLGWMINQRYPTQWGKLGSTLMFIGALVLCISLGSITNTPFITPLSTVAILLFASVISGSRLLIICVPFIILAAFDGSPRYWHAIYDIPTENPVLAISIFSALTYVSWQFAKLQTGQNKRLAIVFARTCILLLNLSFLTGSLHFSEISTPRIVFVVVWALALLSAGAWGIKHRSSFIVNTAATFAALHFYSQWFLNIGTTSFSFILAGIATVIFALWLRSYNRLST